MTAFISRNRQILFLYIITILKHPIYNPKWLEYQMGANHDNDIEFFAKFSIQLTPKCQILSENTITPCKSLLRNINSLFGVKNVHYGSLITSENRRIPIVVKYFGSSRKKKGILEKFEKVGGNDSLPNIIFSPSSSDGTRFCPQSSIDRFFNSFNLNKDPQLKLLLLNMNMQLVILPLLNEYNKEEQLEPKFRVPKVYDICGLTMYQSYDGESLTNFFDSSFELKLTIAKQLIEQMLRFTDGFNGFRIYFTDFNADNIVFDREAESVSFIDLDNVIIVDSSSQSNLNEHTHEMIDCNGCFAFVPDQICSSYVSDINYFAVCQFLREDLHKDRTKGFLHPIPNKLANIASFLNTCIDCPKMQNCTNRLDILQRLLNEINITLPRN